jgi:hypothetical protein
MKEANKNIYKNLDYIYRIHPVYSLNSNLFLAEVFCFDHGFSQFFTFQKNQFQSALQHYFDFHLFEFLYQERNYL